MDGTGALVAGDCSFTFGLWLSDMVAVEEEGVVDRVRLTGRLTVAEEVVRSDGDG